MKRFTPFQILAIFVTLFSALALSSCITCERCSRKRAAAAAAATGQDPQSSPAATVAAPPAGQTAW